MKDYEDTVSRLPELPVETFEVNGTLEFSSTAPVLTIRPHEASAPEPPVPPAAAIKKSQHSARKYLTQVTYPRVICYPLSDLVLDVATKLSETPQKRLEPHERDVEVIAKHERFFKLSSFKGNPLNDLALCSVKYGPWTAMAIEQESCTLGVPNLWLLFIVEMPEVKVEWFGTWDDIPPVPSLQVISGDLTLIEESTACCPGFKWCGVTGSCIPQTVNCDDAPFPV